MTTLPMKRVPMTKSKGVPTNAPLVSAQNVAAVETTTASVQVPMMRWKQGHVRKDCYARLTREQATTLREVQMGLEQQEAMLSNGKFVASPVDAIRWMLENLRKS